jgi:hypothetical protein
VFSASASPQSADLISPDRFARVVPILLQKSQNTRRRFFRKQRS